MPQLFRQLGHHLSDVCATSTVSSLASGEMIQHNCIGEMSVIPTAAPSAGDTRLVVPGISPGTPAKGLSAIKSWLRRYKKSEDVAQFLRE